MSVWLITGGSSGLGKDLALEAASRGHDVVVFARTSGPQAKGVVSEQVDITDADAVDAAVKRTVERFGRIDVVINNAGVGLVGAVEEASDAEIRAIFDVNLLAPLALVRQVLPVLRQQRSGLIVSISSLAVQAGSASWGIYAASKAALATVTESLGKEIAPFGLRTLIVEPGILRTDFLASERLQHSALQIPDYVAQQEARSAVERNRGTQPGDPAQAARLLVDIIDSGNFPDRVPLGEDAERVARARIARVQDEAAQWPDLVRPISYA